ncbi:MAG: hypothetical protein AB8G15_22730, partial [Saprospiraceae bacterium]
ICFWMSKQWIQQKKTAWIILLFPVLLCSHTFYWIQSELLQSCILLLFTFGLSQYQRKFHPLITPLTYGLAILVLFSHPLIFIPYVFIWGFLFLSEKENRSLFFSTLVLLVPLCLFTKYFLLPQGIYAYDQGHTSLTADFFKKCFQYNHLPSTINFRAAWLTDYYLYPLLLLVTTIHYLWDKQFLKLGFVLSACFSYLLLVNTTYNWGIVTFHVESFYQVLAIFLLYPLVYDIFPRHAHRRWLWYLIPIVLVVRLGNMSIRHERYTERVSYLQKLVNKSKSQTGTKFYSYEKEVDKSKLFLSWSTPYESLMMTARLHPDSARTLYISTQEKVDKFVKKAQADQWLSPYGPMDQMALPQRYFRLRDTLGPQYLPIQ